MSALENLNLAIVGACGRGASFRLACEALDNVTIHAVCDVNEEGLDKAKETLGAAEGYTDYDEMLAKSDIDAVIIGTPMQFHVPQSVKALDAGKHAMSEVTAAVSVDECKDLVAAQKKSGNVYMMAENYTYSKSNQIVKEMVRQGKFGTPYYAEGEYLHELKGLNEITKWRRHWQNGIDGITYGTHSLGPIMQWFPGDRVVRVCCEGSGHHHKDPRGEDYAQDTSVMLCKMKNGGLIKIRVDMISDRPHSMSNYQLQGTDGCYESTRSACENFNRIWLRDHAPDVNTWQNLDDIADEYIPENWRTFEELAKKAGHGGGDLLEVIDFVNAITGKAPTPVGIHEAMDMTMPGLISQQSIQEDGAWVDVPDTREW